MKKFLKFAAAVMNVKEEEIDENTKYKEFKKWDSLMMMNLIMEIEEEYNVTIPLERIGTITTLKDLFEFTEE